MPFLPLSPGSKYASLAPDLARAANTQASRICHSTGPRNAINPRPGKPARLCRGARNAQIEHWHRIGFISAPTQEAWDAKLAELKADRRRPPLSPKTLARIRRAQLRYFSQI